jgi:elongation factor G
MIVLWLGIEPKNRRDLEKLGTALQHLMSEDPQLSVKSAQEGGVLLGAASEAQLERVIDRLVHRSGVEASIARLEIAYKEALTADASGEAKYAHQSNGRGQYAHVKIRVRPGGQGSGFVFENVIAGGSIPAPMIPAVEAGIADVLDRGVVSGYPIDDVHVVLYDGSYHEIDSSPEAFRIAGAQAFLNAAKKAQPALLEPFMRVSIATPPNLESRVSDALRARRGERFFATDTRHEEVRSEQAGPTVVITAELPLSQLLGFEHDLRHRTNGLVTCSMQFSHYGPATTAGDDGDRDTPVRQPRHPRKPPLVLRATVPEPEEGGPDDVPTIVRRT